MTTEQLLDALFRGEDLDHEQGVTLRMALSWKPWWPFMDTMVDCLEFGLPDDEFASWPIAWRLTYVEALAVLKPLYELWSAA